MDKKKIFLAVQSLLCIILAVMLAFAAVGIYRNGLAQKAEDPLSWIYTREKAAGALIPVLPLLVFSFVLTFIGLFMGIRDENAEKPVKSTEYLRDLTAARVASPGAAMKAETDLQKKLLYGGWAVFAAAMIPVLLYITNGNHFPGSDLESAFLALIAHVLPWTAIGLAALMITGVLREKSMQREIEAAKEQIRMEKEEGITKKPEKTEKSPAGRIRMLRAALLALSVLLITAGVYNGSAKDVLGKAINICTECIGLG